MNIELIDDEGGQVQATLFKDIADKFNDILVEGRVFTMQGGLIKENAGRFATVKNDYCIVFDKFTDIQEIPDDNSIEVNTDKDHFHFSPISDIGDLTPNDTVDLIGIVYVVGPVGQVQLKNGEVK